MSTRLPIFNRKVEEVEEVKKAPYSTFSTLRLKYSISNRKGEGFEGEKKRKPRLTGSISKRFAVTSAAQSVDNADNGRMKNETSVDKKRLEIERKLKSYVVAQSKGGYSAKNFQALFPQNSKATPLGEVKVYKAQFVKLGKKDNGARKFLLGAMEQTLSDPVCILKQEPPNEAFLYIKSFGDGGRIKNIVLTVVKDRRGRKIAVSTHPKDLKNILNKIKSPADILYEKGGGGEKQFKRKPE